MKTTDQFKSDWTWQEWDAIMADKRAGDIAWEHYINSDCSVCGEPVVNDLGCFIVAARSGTHMHCCPCGGLCA